MSLAGKQHTAQYHRIQASVSRQAAVCCGSAEKELRARHLNAAKLHEAQAVYLKSVETLLEAARVEADDIAAQFMIADPLIIAALRQAYLAGRAAQIKGN